MSGSGNGKGKTVFVGNIAYDVTQDNLMDLFSNCGPVASFRMVTDKETGKPKGYGFCEFRDAAAAQAAMRNLNGYELNGRTLRVDFADNESGGSGAVGGGMGSIGQAPSAGGGRGAVGGATGQAASSSEGFRTEYEFTDALAHTLSKMSKVELMEVLSQMRFMLQKNPQQVRHILLHCPALTQALFQAQASLGLIQGVPVGASAMTPLTHTSGASIGSGLPQGGAGVIGGAAPSMFGGTPGMMLHGVGGVPPVAVPQGQPHGGGGLLGAPPGPPIGMLPMGSAGLGPHMHQQIDLQQQAMLQQVMLLTPEQILALPPAQQQEIRLLQMQLQHGGVTRVV